MYRTENVQMHCGFELKYVESAHKTDELLDLIPTLKGKTLVFTATKRTADSIEGILCRNRNQLFFNVKISKFLFRRSVNEVEPLRSEWGDLFEIF